MGTGKAAEKAQESLKIPTQRKTLSYAFGASSNLTWIKLFRRVGLFSWRICKDLVIHWNPIASLQLPGPLFIQRLLSLLGYHVLNTSKDSSERDILRVNSGWINKTLQNEHCCWSLNVEILWLHHLIQHTWDNKFYGTCNTLSSSWQVGTAIIRIYGTSDLLMPQSKKTG